MFSSDARRTRRWAAIARGRAACWRPWWSCGPR